jgi:diketogulonate reductase-like aldo/keto reductase
VVESAISAGYRHIDTAAAYANERQVDEGWPRTRDDHCGNFGRSIPEG